MIQNPSCQYVYKTDGLNVPEEPSLGSYKFTGLPWKSKGSPGHGWITRSWMDHPGLCPYLGYKVRTNGVHLNFMCCLLFQKGALHNIYPDPDQNFIYTWLSFNFKVRPVCLLHLLRNILLLLIYLFIYLLNYITGI